MREEVGWLISLYCVGAANPFGERLFFLEEMPSEETAVAIGLYNDGAVLQGSVGQENVVVGALHLLFVSPDSLRNATLRMDGVRVLLYNVYLALARLILAHLLRCEALIGSKG